MHNLPEATPAQLAQLKLKVPNVSRILNELQMSTIAANMDFVLLGSAFTVRRYLENLVRSSNVTEEKLVEVVRTIRIALLRPAWEAETDRQIGERGYAVRSVHASHDAPGFVYTVGFTATAGFELLVHADLPPQMLSYVLHCYAELAKGHENLEIERNDIIWESSNLDMGISTKCVEVDLLTATRSYVCETRGEVRRVLQVLIADKNNHFPDDSGYDRELRQPCLARPI